MSHAKEKIRDFVHLPLIQISARMTVFDASKWMRKHEVGAILVTEGKNFVGIFTEADLLNKVVALSDSPGSTSLTKVITRRLLHIDAEASMVAAFLMMHKKNIRHLVVKDNQTIIGVLSITDVAKYYVHKFSTVK